MATASTETETTSGAAPTRKSEFRPYRITVDVYDRIAASGALGDKSRVFLWDGLLVQKVSDMTKGHSHVFALNRLARIIPSLVPAGYYSEQDQPIELGNARVPEPDLKVVRGADTDFRARTPTASDCPLVAEVSDSSLADDTGEMLQAYAAAMIPVYWVVNLPNRRIDVYTVPSGPTAAPSYADCQSFGPGEQVPVVLDGREVGRIAVDEILP